MSRGRKPDAKAQRRAKDRAEITPALVEAGVPAAIEKPISVALAPGMSDLWDTLVGSGIAYTQQDAPFIEQLVFDLETARQCRDKCIDEFGNVIVFVGKGEPDPETGVYLDTKPNPYLKQMREATAEALKLADQLGCTQLARARLGLTQAAGKAVTMSIAQQIDEAMRRSGK